MVRVRRDELIAQALALGYNARTMGAIGKRRKSFFKDFIDMLKVGKRAMEAYEVGKDVYKNAARNIAGELAHTVAKREHKKKIISALNELPIQKEKIQSRGRSIRTANVNSKFVDVDNMKARVYTIGDLNFPASDVRAIMEIIGASVNHALMNGFTDEASIHVTMTTELSHSNRLGSFYSKVIKIKDLNRLIENITMFNENYHALGKDYVLVIHKIIVKLVKANSGGCNDTCRDKCKSIDGLEILDKRSKNNNCLFNSMMGELGFDKRVGRARANVMRAYANVPVDATIDIQNAMAIFEHYKVDRASSLRIIDNESGTAVQSNEGEVTVTLMLKDGHYTRVIGESKKWSWCDRCLRKYLNTHKCNENNVSYLDRVVRGKREMMMDVKKDTHNNASQVLHYDIETYRKDVGKSKVHEPNAVGYTYNDEYITFTGDDCMDDFVKAVMDLNNKNMARMKENKELMAEIEKLQLVLADAEYKAKAPGSHNMKKNAKQRIKSNLKKIAAFYPKIYVNAYNGSNFDHYYFMKSFEKLYGAPKCMNMHNGSIIGFNHENIKLVDLCKHTGGSLSTNLTSWGCKIKKGDFDHDKATRWEDMSDDMRLECLTYLKADVLGLKELYEKYNSSVFDKYQLNITNYISTSSLAFNLWKDDVKEMGVKIMLPNVVQEKAFRQAVRGGRTYKSKHRFISEQYEAFKRGEIGFDQITDYIVDADVVSLYPAAMANYEYPVGEAIETKEIMADKMGIYHVHVVPNKNLIHSIGGRRGNKGELHWDLEETTGWYTSVDIEDMLKRGYKVEMACNGDEPSGYYWDRSVHIYKSFIDKMFTMKNSEAKGSPQYLLAKLFMNALYGKMIQRPIDTKSKFISTNAEYWKFFADHEISSFEQINNSWYISGISRDEKVLERNITKPSHLGAFILAYSRRIMLEYIDEANPAAKILADPNFNVLSKEQQHTIRQEAIANDFYYTDTDSLHVHIKNAPKFSKQLGGIAEDLGDGCKIIRGIWIAPKLYTLEYVKADGSIHQHFRGKGLDTRELTFQKFVNMDSGKCLENIRPFSMKKINVKRNSNQMDIPQFSIVHQEDVKRVVNKTIWGGREFHGNHSVPHGCVFNADDKVKMKVIDSCRVDVEEEKNIVARIVANDTSVNGKSFYHSIEHARNDPHVTDKNILISREVMYEGADKSTRQFAYFSDYDIFWAWYEGVDQDERHFHEVVRDGEMRRIFIDYDCPNKGWFTRDGHAIMQATLDSVLNSALVVAVDNVCGVRIDASKSIARFDNSRPGKLSTHLVVHDYVCDASTNKMIAEEMARALRKMDHEVVKCDGNEIDLQPYNSTSSLRLPGSSKLGLNKYPKGFAKMMLKNFKHDKVTYVYPKTAVSIHRKRVDDGEVLYKMPNDLAKAIESNAIFKDHKFKTMKNCIASFTRLNASHCDLCCRTHENDNTLYALKKQDMWVYGCTRIKRKTLKI